MAIGGFKFLRWVALGVVPFCMLSCGMPLLAAHRVRVTRDRGGHATVSSLEVTGLAALSVDPGNVHGGFTPTYLRFDGWSAARAEIADLVAGEDEGPLRVWFDGADWWARLGPGMPVMFDTTFGVYSAVFFDRWWAQSQGYPMFEAVILDVANRNVQLAAADMPGASMVTSAYVVGFDAADVTRYAWEDGNWTMVWACFGGGFLAGVVVYSVFWMLSSWVGRPAARMLG